MEQINNKNKKIFLVVISVLILGVATLFTLTLANSFKTESIFVKYFWPAVWALLLGGLFGFGWLLSHSKKKSFWFAWLAVLPFLIFFIREPIIMLVGLVAGFTFWLAWWRGTIEREISFKISLGKIFRVGLPIFFTGLALLISSFYYFFNINEVKNGQFEVLQESQGFALVGDLVLEAVVGPDIKNLSFKLSVDDFITQIIKQKSGLDENFLGDERFSGALKQGVEGFKQEINQTYGLDLRGDETVASVIRIFINDKIKSAFGPYQKYIPLVFAIAMFLALKAVSFIYVWLVIFFSWLLYRLLLALRIIRIGKEMAEKEAIIF